MEVERGTGTAVFTAPHSFYGPTRRPPEPVHAPPTPAPFQWPPLVRRRAPRGPFHCGPFITGPRVAASSPPPVVAASYVNGGFGAVPASEKAIAGLPETTAREKGCCPVCMEAFGGDGEGHEALRRMECCSHAFHEECISTWLRASHLCPLCRFPLPTTQEQEDQERMGSAGGGG